MQEKSEVYICGYEMISAAGASAAQAFSTASERLAASRHASGVSGYFFHPDAEQKLEKIKKLAGFGGYDRAVLGMIACARSLREKISLPNDLGQFGCVIATSRGTTGSLENALTSFAQGRPAGVKTSPMTSGGIFASAVASDLQLGGGHFTVSSTCTSGLNAIGVGFGLIKSGVFKHCLSGGAEAPLTPFTAAMLTSSRVLGPCDEAFPLLSLGADRRGMVLGEGAGALYLSSEKRDTAVAKILGFGIAGEDAGLTGISSNALALQKAVESALSQANLQITDMDLLIPHGSGTVKGDQSEATAYGEIFGSSLPTVMPTKWFTGHTLGAAGVQATCLGLEAMHMNQVVIPPYQLIDKLGGASREWERIRRVMVCGLGFGGGASCLILQKP